MDTCLDLLMGKYTNHFVAGTGLYKEKVVAQANWNLKLWEIAYHQINFMKYVRSILTGSLACLSCVCAMHFPLKWGADDSDITLIMS